MNLSVLVLQNTSDCTPKVQSPPAAGGLIGNPLWELTKPSPQSPSRLSIPPYQILSLGTYTNLDFAPSELEDVSELSPIILATELTLMMYYESSVPAGMEWSPDLTYALTPHTVKMNNSGELNTFSSSAIKALISIICITRRHQKLAESPYWQYSEKKELSK